MENQGNVASPELSEFLKEFSLLRDRSSQVKLATEFILSERKATSPNKALSTNQIIDGYHELSSAHPETVEQIPNGTFNVFLSKSSKEKDSKITCRGRKQGYYLDNLVEKLENKTVENEVSDASFTDRVGVGDIVYEKDLYPFFKEWLFEKSHNRVADISSLKKNGKWGNPDLIGISIEELYGKPDIEVTTIEVKLSDDNWEQWIFEAVAHTRFSNRSYFAFAYPEGLISKLDSTQIKLYAEHFKIGILILAVDDNDYVKIKKREKANLTDDNVSIVEYAAAPYNNTHIKFRKKFFESLEILELNKLYGFGDGLNV